MIHMSALDILGMADQTRLLCCRRLGRPYNLAYVTDLASNFTHSPIYNAQPYPLLQITAHRPIGYSSRVRMSTGCE